MGSGMKWIDSKRSDLLSNKLLVTGRGRKPLELGMEELRSMVTEEIADLMIICGDGDPKGNIRNCRGVLLENVIRIADVIKEEHNDTKKMFIVVSAHDGYKVVFSWQEIFNTSVGGGVMVLLERDGKPLDGEQGCATNLLVKPSRGRAMLPKILPSAAHKAASEGDDAVRPLDCPVHS